MSRLFALVEVNKRILFYSVIQRMLTSDKVVELFYQLITFVMRSEHNTKLAFVLSEINQELEETLEQTYIVMTEAVFQVEEYFLFFSHLFYTFVVFLKLF